MEIKLNKIPNARSSLNSTIKQNLQKSNKIYLSIILEFIL